MLKRGGQKNKKNITGGGGGVPLNVQLKNNRLSLSGKFLLGGRLPEALERGRSLGQLVGSDAVNKKNRKIYRKEAQKKIREVTKKLTTT